MSNEQNKPFPFAELLLFWLLGFSSLSSNNEELIRNYLKSLSAEKIDEIIEMVKETPVEEKYKEATINKINEIRNNREKGGEK